MSGPHDNNRCSSCGYTEGHGSDCGRPVSLLVRLREERDAARLALAWVRNRQLDTNVTAACMGAWESCWCDDCEKRRLLKKSGRLFTNYEVFSLSLDEVKAYVSSERRGGTT